MSRPKCVISGCGTSGRVARDLGISFHEIPSSDIRKKWLKIINIPDVKAEAKVCSMHFHEDDYKRTAKKRVLKPCAVPSLFIGAQPPVVIDLCDSEKSDFQPISELVMEELGRSNSIACDDDDDDDVVEIPQLPYPAFSNGASHSTLGQEVVQDIAPDAQSCQLSFLGNSLSADNSVIKLSENLIPFVGDSTIIQGATTSGNGFTAEINSRTENSPYVHLNLSSAPVQNIINEEHNATISPVYLPNMTEQITTAPLLTQLPAQLNAVNINPQPVTHISLIDETECERTQNPSCLLHGSVDHCYSIPPNYENMPEDDHLSNSVRNTVTSVETAQNKTETWSGPDAFNQAMDAQKNRKMSVENRILKKKLLELNVQYRRSVANLKKTIQKLNSKLKWREIRGKMKQEGHKRILNKYSKPSQNDFTFLSANLRKGAEDATNLKANFLLDQIKMFGQERTCFGKSTLKVSKMWFEKGPEAYKYIRDENLLTLPPISMLQELDSSSDDSIDVTQYEADKMLRECEKLSQKEKIVSLYVDVKDKNVLDACSESISSIGIKKVKLLNNNQILEAEGFLDVGNADSVFSKICNYFISFAITGLTTHSKKPYAIYSLNRVDGITLANLTKAVIKRLEEMGFAVVRLVCQCSDLTLALFKHLGMGEVPQVVHPVDSSKMLSISYDSIEIVKEICDKFVSYAFEGTDEIVRKTVLGDLKKLRSVEAINPASYFLSFFLEKKAIRGFSCQRYVEVFSGPVTAAVAELKRKYPSAYQTNFNFLIMLEKWKAIEDFLNGIQNYKMKNRKVPTIPKDDEVSWLDKTFREYLKSSLKCSMMPYHQDLINAIVLCNSSAVLCMPYLVKVMSSLSFISNSDQKDQIATRNSGVQSHQSNTKKRKQSEVRSFTSGTFSAMSNNFSSLNNSDETNFAEPTHCTDQPLSSVNVDSFGVIEDESPSSKKTCFVVFKTTGTTPTSKDPTSLKILQSKNMNSGTSDSSNLSVSLGSSPECAKLRQYRKTQSNKPPLLPPSSCIFITGIPGSPESKNSSSLEALSTKSSVCNVNA